MSYDLPESRVRWLTAAALAVHPSTGRFAALAVHSDDPMADVARTVECQVFEAAFANDAAKMRAQYGPYEDASLFFLVLDRETGMPAGTGRVIDGGGRTLDVAPDHIGRDLSDIVRVHRMHDGKIWDFATLAVLPAYRGNNFGLAVSSLLYRTFLKAGRRAGVKHLICMLDHAAYRNLLLIGAPFVAMAGSAPFAYLGSAESRALYVPFAELEPAIAEQGRRLGRLNSAHAGQIPARGLRRLLVRRVASRVSEQIAAGTGLDENIVLNAPERRRLAHRR